MKIKFFKMQGEGNDYIFVDCRKGEISDLGGLSKRLSERRYSVGGDGLVAVLPSESCDCKIKMFNADGSEGAICGTALRCTGRFLLGKSSGEVTVETAVGPRRVIVQGSEISVEMGRAIFRGQGLPCVGVFLLPFGGREYLFTAVSVGNPHAVCIVDSLDIDVLGIARELEQSGIFKDGVNVELVLLDKDKACVRVVERGSGETFSCGSGACAVAAVLCRHGVLPFGNVGLEFKGGKLQVAVDKDFSVLLTGSGRLVYEGRVENE